MRGAAYEYGMGGGGVVWPGIWRLLLFLLVSGIWLALVALLPFQGLRDAASMEQAEIARHLAEGRGFVTHVSRPVDGWLRGEAADAGGAPVAVLWQAPGYPYVLSVFFRMFKPGYTFSAAGLLDAEVRVIVPLSVFLLLSVVSAGWFFAWRVFGLQTANLAGLVLLVSPLLPGLGGQAGALALAMLLGLCCLLATWECILRNAAALRPWGALLLAIMAGFAGGLLVLTHYAAILLVVGIGVFLALELQRLRWLTVALFVGAIAVVLIPWLLVGSGAGVWPWRGYLLEAVQGTGLLPGDSLARSAEPVLPAWQWTRAIREGIAGRYADFFGGRQLALGGFMLVFFLAGLFRREEREWHQHLQWTVAVVLLLLPVLPAVTGCAHGSWTVLYPFLVILGARAFHMLLDREAFFDVAAKPFLTVLLILLCALPTGMQFLQRGQHPYPPYYGPLQAYVSRLLDADRVLVTDIPWATAWYGRQPSLLWPNRPDALSRYGDAPGGIYLAGREDHRAATDAVWQRIRLGMDVPDFLPYQYGIFLPSGSREQLLLIRDAKDGAESRVMLSGQDPGDNRNP